MVLFTPAAAAIPLTGFNLNEIIDGLIGQSNNALKNSLVEPSQLRFSLAFKGLLAGFTESNNIIFDLNSFISNSTVQSLRSANAADCVVLLTDGDYDDFLGLTPGCGPSAAGSFSIVQLKAAASRMTFTHELGHQFGCKHNFGASNGGCEPTFERPFEFKRGLRTKTTMMQPGGVNRKHRIPHFSNPDANYHGHATGRFATPEGLAETNNARQLREQAATVAAYSDLISPPSPSLTIDGPDDLCIRTGVNPIGTFRANVCNWATSSYTLAWQISVNDGTIYGSALSTSSTLALNALSFSLEDIIFVRLTLTDASGVQTFAFYQAVVGTCGGHEPPHGLVAPGKEKMALQLTPNPATDYVSASFHLAETSPVTITLLDVSGTKIRLLEQKTLEVGELNFTWNLGDLPTGIYQIQMASNRSTEVQKVAIFH